MARKKTPSTHTKFNTDLSLRLREIRKELFGEHGGPELARRLDLPVRTWYNYETGVTVPAEVLFHFIEQTGANPVFLFTGEGGRYLGSQSDAEPPASKLPVADLLRNALERLEASPGELGDAPSTGAPADYVPISLHPLERIGERGLGGSAGEGQVLALRRWIANPAQTIAVRLTDDAMHPVLPAGSIAAVDRTLTDPEALQGRIVAARSEDGPIIRWLDVGGRHLIFRPNLIGGGFPIIPLEIGRNARSPIIGQVVCSWNRFSGA